MTKFETLLDQMLHDKLPAHRTHAFERLFKEFPEKKETLTNEVFDRGSETLRRRLAVLLAEEGNSRGFEVLGKYLDAELKANTMNADHWTWLSSYFDVYRKKRDLRTIARFFPYTTCVDSHLGLNVIQAIRELKMKDGVPFLLKAAALNQEHAIVALGEIGGPESIQPLLEISRSAGAVNKRLAKEAVEKIRKRT